MFHLCNCMRICYRYINMYIVVYTYVAVVLPVHNIVLVYVGTNVRSVADIDESPWRNG